MYLSGLPKSFNLTGDFLYQFRKYNKKRKTKIILYIVYYSILKIIIAVTCIIILIKTKNFIQKILLKLLKISQDNIIKLLENIRNFKESYLDIKKINKNNNKNFETFINLNNELLKNQNYNNFSRFSLDSDNVKYKKLTLENKNYFYIVFFFILDIIFCVLIGRIVQYGINNNKLILETQAFLYGRFLLKKY